VSASTARPAPPTPWRLRVSSVVAALVVSLSGCDLVPQGYLDPDGDGWAWPEDCDGGRADVNPDAAERWYDGVDQDCDGLDDYDQDADGWVATEHEGLVTEGVPGSGALPAGDCWDDPTTQPRAFEVNSSELTDAAGQPLAWVQPQASEVNPGVDEVWYDVVDQDCDGADDLDQDGDGWLTQAYPDRGGVFGDDCVDGASLDDDNPAGTEPSQVHPDAEEHWYDGTDQDCDGNDCDQDGDGYFGGDGEYCMPTECDDTDAEIFPTDEPELVWYDGIDDNCDGNDGDQDGDGFWARDYQQRVASSGSGQEPLDIPVGVDGDCWDVPVAIEGTPDAYSALNGFVQPEPEQVYPGQAETWYDGVDQDCAADDDFDQDGDSFTSDTWPDREGALGEDCDDSDGTVYPGQIESYYDGVDDSCAFVDGDADADGYWIEGYAALVESSGGVPLVIPADCGDSGTSSCADDCDDGAPSVHPDQYEDCGTPADDDCDGDANFDDDPGDALGCTTFYLDLDGDGHGTTAGDCTCEPVGSYTGVDGDDCDDGDADTWPGADEHCDGHDDDCDGAVDEDDAVDATTWYADVDGDGYGDSSTGQTSCAQPDGYLADGGDCDDLDSLVHPGADEHCDGSDHDCDGLVNEDDSVDALDVYDDVDGDGYGDSSGGSTACTQPSGTSLDGSDCDDSDAAIHPGSDEYCDGVDHDCDGLVNEDDSVDASSWYADGDGDGYGDASTTVSACSLPSGASADDTDCDDGDAAVYPGAVEQPGDGVDQDCDAGELCYEDGDGDGYGTSVTVSSVDLDCSDSGESGVSSDCDDGDADISPGADEHCDGADHDCDGLVYEDSSVDAATWYQDMDGDGYGRPSVSTTACAQPTGYVAADVGEDCDDSRAASNPSASEYCNGYDDDCDGTTDEDDALDASTWYADSDGDGYGTVSSTQAACTQPDGHVASTTDCDDSRAASNPSASEYCNGYDDDCDGTTDEDDALDASTWYIDYDGDGYGSSSYTAPGCDAPSGYAADSDDCDDTEPTVYPGATEICFDGLSNDCEGSWYDDCGLSGEIDLASADAIILGEYHYDNAGYSLAVGGDIDSDGLPDLLVGAMDSDWSDTDSGAVYVVLGSSAATTTSLSSAHAVLVGEDEQDYVGSSVAWAGDVDADGVSDILVGGEADRAYLVLGPVSGELDLRYADAELYGSSSDEVGYVVAGAGDVDHDGYDDVLVGSLDNEAYLWNGPIHSSSSTSGADATFDAERGGDDVGTALAGGSDVDGDGLTDVLIGAPGSDNSGSNAGCAYLVFGPPSGTVRLSSADLTLEGESSHDSAGLSVAMAGDVDGDGLCDLLVGAPGDDDGGSSAGAAYLITAPGTGTLDLSSATAKLWGEASGDYAGFVVAAAGDPDGDGLGDFLVGAPLHSGGGIEAGAGYLVLGSAAGNMELSSAVATFIGEAAGDGGGYAVVGGEDLDGDGHDEVLLGAPWNDGAEDNAGAIYLFEGGGM
jgi:hypothetical protein